MTDAARKAKREYMRKWRAEHRESIAQSNARYWAKRAKAMGLADDDQDAEKQSDLEAANTDE